jgi:hypothetical protein
MIDCVCYGVVFYMYIIFSFNGRKKKLFGVHTELRHRGGRR